MGRPCAVCVSCGCAEDGRFTADRMLALGLLDAQLVRASVKEPYAQLELAGVRFEALSVRWGPGTRRRRTPCSAAFRNDGCIFVYRGSAPGRIPLTTTPAWGMDGKAVRKPLHGPPCPDCLHCIKAPASRGTAHAGTIVNALHADSGTTRGIEWVSFDRVRLECRMSPLAKPVRELVGSRVALAKDPDGNVLVASIRNDVLAALGEGMEPAAPYEWGSAAYLNRIES